MLFSVLVLFCTETTPVDRVGGAFCAPSNELVGNAFCAFSTARARSTGFADDQRPLRIRCTRRSRRGSTHSFPLQSTRSIHVSLFPIGDEPSPGDLRREGPLSVSRCARWMTRSRIASATVGSPRYSCQRSAGS